MRRLVMLLVVAATGFGAGVYPRAADRMERSGCCSHHGGVCGCSGGTARCCDGTLSPSCDCS